YQQTRTPDVDLKQIKARAPQGREKDAQTAVETLTTAKQHASYWLGLVSFEHGNYPAAVDYLKTRTLDAWPDGPWTYGAQYNLGRSLEALGKPAEAAAAYRGDHSPQRAGSLLRAKRCQAKAAGEKAA